MVTPALLAALNHESYACTCCCCVVLTEFAEHKSVLLQQDTFNYTLTLLSGIEGRKGVLRFIGNHTKRRDSSRLAKTKRLCEVKY
jgi:hypothetical protein